MFWSALEIAARYGVQFFVVVALARLLSPSDFGLIAMLLVFTSIGALMVDSGFSSSLVQRQNTTADDETTVFLFTTAMGVLLFAVLWLCAPAIANFYDQPSLVGLTRLVAFVLPLSALSAVPDACLTQQLNFRTRARTQILSSLGSAIVAVFLALRGFGVWSLAWQSVIAALLRVILLWVYSGWRPSGKFRQKSLRSLFSYGGYMLLASVLDTFTTRLQSLLIGKMFDVRALGYYTIAQSAQSAPTTLVGAFLNRVGLPVFSSIANQPKKLIGALRLSLRVSLFVFVPCMIGMALTARMLIELLYGRQWVEAAPILVLLSLSATFWPLHVLNLAALSGQGRSDLFFRLELVKKLIGISLIVVFSPFGPIAIAAAVLVSSVLGLLINTWYSGKLFGYGTAAQLRDQIPTLALMVPALLVGWSILHWTAEGYGHTALAIVASATVYVGAALVFRNTALTELISVFKDIRVAQQSTATFADE